MLLRRLPQLVQRPQLPHPLPSQRQVLYQQHPQDLRMLHTKHQRRRRPLHQQWLHQLRRHNQFKPLRRLRPTQQHRLVPGLLISENLHHRLPLNQDNRKHRCRPKQFPNLPSLHLRQILLSLWVIHLPREYLQRRLLCNLLGHLSPLNRPPILRSGSLRLLLLQRHPLLPLLPDQLVQPISLLHRR